MRSERSRLWWRSRRGGSFPVTSRFASRRRGLEREDGGIKFLIVFQGGLCMFQLLLGYPGVFFGQVSFPLDQEHVCRWRTMVV